MIRLSFSMSWCVLMTVLIHCLLAHYAISMHCALFLIVMSKFNDSSLMHALDWASNIFCLRLHARLIC
jgi:hypothetical protein